MVTRQPGRVFVTATVETVPAIMGQEPTQERNHWTGECVMDCIYAQKRCIITAFQYRHQMQDHFYWRLRVATDIRVPVLAEDPRHHSVGVNIDDIGLASGAGNAWINGQFAELATLVFFRSGSCSNHGRTDLMRHHGFVDDVDTSLI